jgi:lipopolysaccharide transport system permease protein
MNDKTKPQEWTRVITPKRHFFELRLGEVWEYRDLVFLLVKRDFVAAYKQTILGHAWHFIIPFVNTILFTLIFANLAGISTEGVPAPLFYVCSLVSWGYFAKCLSMTSSVFKSNEGVFGKVYFPRLVVPIATIFSSLLQLAIQSLLFWSFVAFFGFKDGYWANVQWEWIWLVPVFVAMFSVIALGAGVLTSALTTKYRDLTIFIAYGVQLLMYLSAVVYPYSAVPAQYAKAAALNPIVPIMEGIRFVLLGVGELHWERLGYTAGFMGILFVLGLLVFNRVEQTFMDTV